ncbi:BatA and WFA domain-containing protein [Verrucomicrobia bacterium]|nr:BatA and WFA domain-containing protein [Verrucomicrobiota bacterium]MDA7866958.1 BatA and WFA domain-containing protein [Verrucomicrobiota bacterium]
MGLTNPIMLAFLGLFIPVIALYLLKQRRRRVEVASLLFWDKILKDEQTVTSLTRLKKILSLLLQLIFILLLTFALARPLVSDGLTGARRIVMYLDTSASMLVQEEDQSRFELAKTKALDLVKGMAQGDTMMIVSVNQHPNVIRPFTNSKRDLEAAIESLHPIHTDTNFESALKILDQLETSRQDTHVFLITDGAFVPIDFTPPETFQFGYINVGETTHNIGITEFQVRPLPDSPRDFQIHLEISNGTDQTITAPLELRLNGALTDAYEITLQPNESIKRLIRQYSAEGGSVEVFVDYPDAFEIDNRAFGRLTPPSPIKVQLVIDSNLFLETALLTDRNVELDVVGPAEVKPSEDFDVTIYAASTPTTTPLGNSVFINRWPTDLQISTTGDLESPLITDWDRDHPINRHLALQNIAINSAHQIALPDSFEILMSSFESPLIALEENTLRKVLVIAFDPLATDLPLRVAFPIMIANAVRYLQGNENPDSWMNPSIVTDFSIADLSKLNPSSDSISEIDRVILPDHTEQSLKSPDTLVRADQVGFYLGERKDNQTTPLFAVNLTSTAESRIATNPEIPINSKEPIKEITTGFRLGYEPWFFVALVAVLLSITEWFLFHRRLIE